MAWAAACRQAHHPACGALPLRAAPRATRARPAGPPPAPFLGRPCALDACPLPPPAPAATGSDGDTESDGVPPLPAKWWEAGAEAWAAAPRSEAEFRAAVAAAGRPGGPALVLVDFYATWCKGCAKVYPALVELAADPDVAGRVAFVKVCNDRLGALARAEGATALPHIGLYGAGGARVLDFQARPSRLHLLKGNLLKVLETPVPAGQAWALDPDGQAVLVDAAASAARAAENAAAAAAAAAASASLGDRLMAMAGGGGTGAAPAPPPPPPPSSTPSLSERLARLAGGGGGPPPPRPPPPQEGPASRPGARPAAARTPSAAEAAFRADPVYGPMYNPRADAVFDAEIGPRLGRGQAYLDYTGAGLYLDSQIDAVAAELKAAVYGNPHSANPSSARSEAGIEAVRAQVLAWLGADPAEWQVVFTASATAAAKLVGEAFPWSPRSTYVYLRESHTSLIGLREYAHAAGATHRAVTEDEVEAWVAGAPGGGIDLAEGDATSPTYSLFQWPSERNFDGVKHVPLSRWTRPVQALSTPGHRVLVAMDASAFVPTQPLDLTEAGPDYVFLSFYKVFGYPTGVGALIMRNDAAELLDRPYFGGGTVSILTASDDYHQLKCRPADRFADGSPSFLDIMALRHGFAALEALGGVAAASPHVAALAHWGAEALARLRHPNGAPMAIVFGKHAHPDWARLQGGVLNFELLDSKGEPLSYREFEVAAAAAGLHLRCGSLCAPGAAYSATDVRESEVRSLAGDKEGCDDDVESILVQRPAADANPAFGWERAAGHAPPLDGQPGGETVWVRRPLGTIRASFGAPSTFRDVEALVRFVEKWVRGMSAI